MSRKSEPPVRWTIDRWSSETKMHPRTIKQALSEHRIVPGEDGKYSTLDFVTSMTGSPEERAARDARLQQQIDEAAIVRNERDLQEGRLVYRTAVRDRVTEVFLKAVQIVRGSKLSERDKRELVKTFGEIKMEPRKILEFEKAL